MRGNKVTKGRSWDERGRPWNNEQKRGKEPGRNLDQGVSDDEDTLQSVSVMRQAGLQAAEKQGTSTVHTANGSFGSWVRPEGELLRSGNAGKHGTPPWRPSASDAAGTVLVMPLPGRWDARTNEAAPCAAEPAPSAPAPLWGQGGLQGALGCCDKATR